jgi:hypothetical protein
MPDTSLIIPNRAVELFANCFDRLFVEPLRNRIPEVARRRQVSRVIGEVSDAAALGLTRFLSSEPPQGMDIDPLFAAARTALAALNPEDVWPPQGSPEARAQQIGSAARPPDWQTAQSARFGIALELVVLALWRTGAVLHAWEQVQFGDSYEPPRQLVHWMRDLGALPPGPHTPRALDLVDDDTFEARFRGYVAQRWGRLEVGTLRAAPALFVSLDDLFVMPQVARKDEAPRPADGVLFDNAHRIMVLIGLPGSGKSTLLLWLQQQVVACRREHVLGNGQALPVLIRLRELRGFSPKIMRDSRRLVELASGSRHLATLMPDGWLDRQFAEGRVLLLLDGLDEAEPAVRDGVLFPWLRRLLKAHPTWRTVITSRPAGFPEAEFTGSQSSSSRSIFKGWHPALYALHEFGPEEVAAYLRNWCIQVRIAQNESVAEATSGGREEAKAIATSISNHQAVDDLARTPLLLSAVCLVYRFEGGKLPDDRATLYRLCVEGLLDRWEAQKGLTSPFTTDTKLRVCKELAAWMMKIRTAECPYEDACRLAAVVLGSVEVADSLLGQVLNRAGLLTEPTPGVLSFAHLTFQEYVAALAVRDENRQGLSVTTLAENLGDTWWLEVILLYCRIAPPALVRQMFHVIFSDRLSIRDVS